EEGGLQLDCPVPCGRQDFLQLMAGALDQALAHGARRALQAVRRPEERLEQLGALAAVAFLFQTQEVVVERAHVVPEFFKECGHEPLEEFVLVHGSLVHCPMSAARFAPTALRSWAACSAWRRAARFCLATWSMLRMAWWIC